MWIRCRALSLVDCVHSCAVWFPRIAVDPETVFVWSKTLRATHFLGQQFFRRTEISLVYILLLFGAVFAYLWYLQLSDAPLSSAILELVYAVLVIFWGGLFLCVTSLHASGANDDFQKAILDLVWRKQEMVAAVANANAATAAAAAARPHTEGHVEREAGGRGGEGGIKAHHTNDVLESGMAIDTAIEICRSGHATEGLSVCGVRLGHQVLTSVAVVTAGQVVLFSQLILRS